MAIENIVTSIALDVYDHDRTPTTIKTIALDKQTRYVQARLYQMDNVYQLPSAGATVELIALRPDKVGVIGSGSVVVVDQDYDEGTQSSVDIYGVRAEMTQAMLAVAGTVLFQFKITQGDQILRTEIFKSDNGRALDGDTSEWAEEYQGYNLDEVVEKLDFIGTVVQQAVSGGITLDQAILETHNYIDRKINERIKVQNNAIYISSH